MTSLFEPGRIGPVQVPNRIVMAPMTTRAADRDGFVTPQTLAYYSARARGGVGLITVEMASPERCGRHRQHELGIFDDRFLPGLARLASAIRAEGAKASIQLGHAGGHTRPDICGEAPIAPSAIAHVVEEVTTEDHHPRGDEQGAHRRDDGPLRCRGSPRRRGGFRLRRDPRRARLSYLPIPHPVREIGAATSMAAACRTAPASVSS
jgi:hypothetical protein